MRLLIVQLSDIHFQDGSNPIAGRVDQLKAAVLSMHPHPEACLVLVTGDVANSGEPPQYKQAATFFRAFRAGIEEVFGPSNVAFDFIAGNHDCYLPKEDLRVREALVSASRPHLSGTNPDPGYLANLGSPQKAFAAFYSEMMGDTLDIETQIYRIRALELAGIRVRIIAINTALLSQRDEQAGTLYLPPAVLERPEVNAGEYDLTVCTMHHPYSWFDPDFKRDLLHKIEASAHIVFTGHEHQQDNHWSESASGYQTAYIEADALQDRNYPKKSGFNALIIGFTDVEQTYYHYRWKVDSYQPVSPGNVHKLSLTQKSFHRFLNTSKFSLFIKEDDFGFTHPRKLDLQLKDFFTYPPLSVTSPTKETSITVPGSQVAAFLLKEAAVYVQGQERSGKTSLVKMLYAHILAETASVPVYLNAGDIPTGVGEPLFIAIDRAVRAQYGDASVEPFRQLPVERRVILIDDFQRLKAKQKHDPRELIKVLKAYFSLVLVTSYQLPQYKDFEAELNQKEPLFSASVSIRELPPSSRAEIIDKWFRLSLPDEQADSLVRDSLRERNLLSDLIRKRALPSLPYLVVGVLQIRQNKKEDLVDPGSFGYLFQRLVVDALSITTTKPHVDRKEGILRRFAYSMFKNGMDGATKTEFDTSVDRYAQEVQIRVDRAAIYADLLAGKVLQETDGFISFRHHYFFHYFVARQLLDDVDSDHPQEARQDLERMADRPLVAANRLTLMFFLFFKKRDPIIDYLLKRSNEVFENEPLSDMTSDARFVDEIGTGLKEARVDETIDVKASDATNLKNEDSAEERALVKAYEMDELYTDTLEAAIKMRFAHARIEMLGQVIRSFSGTLDGSKKQEILETVFRLGLRNIHVMLTSLDIFSQLFAEQAAKVDDKKMLEEMDALFKRIIAWLARIYCDSALLTISRAVGVSDIEQSYEDALKAVGSTCATQLLEVAIKLDHSDVFPFALVKETRKQVAKNNKLASTVLSDLVVRHTQLIPLQKETLKRIASTLNLDTTKLIEAANR